MDEVSPKNNSLLSAILRIRHRLNLGRRMEDLGIKYVPGRKFVKGFLDRSSAKARQILISCQGCKMYVDPTDVGIVSHLLADGVYEPRTTALFKSLLKTGMVVFDIGANFGYYGLIAAQVVGSTGKVYALEPEPNNFRLISSNIKVNGFSNMIPLQVAVSNEKGRATLFLDKTNLGAHSVHHGNVLEAGGAAEVEATTLDSLVESRIVTERVDLITMDVQGAEGLVFEGAEQTLRRNNVKVLMEFWPYGLRNIGTDPRDLIRKIYDYGFAVTLIDEPGQPPDLMEITERLENEPNNQTAVNLLLQKTPSRSS
jgi:FkbM family methyltransferase